MEKPRQIYNCDESGFQMGKPPQKVLVSKGCKHPYLQAPGTRDHITVLACLNAAGDDVPPMIIYGKGYPGGNYPRGAPDNTLFARSESGYIDTILFRKWFETHFLRFAVKERPLLLVFDGHSSHIDKETTDVAIREGVVFLCLPPHLSHVLQPLDVGFFAPLKAEFAKAASNLCQFRHSFVVAKANFARVLSGPYEWCKARRYVVAGFRKCGIFPYNPEAIDTSRLLPTRHPEDATGIPITPSVSSALAAMSGSPAILPSPSSAPHPSPSLAPPPSTSLAPPPSTSLAPLTPEPPRPRIHPLVASGDISEDLVEILRECDYNKKTHRRLPVAARVITGEEYQRLFREREEKQRAAAALKEQRAAAKTTKQAQQAAKAAASSFDATGRQTTSGTIPRFPRSRGTPAAPSRRRGPAAPLALSISPDQHILPISGPIIASPSAPSSVPGHMGSRESRVRRPSTRLPASTFSFLPPAKGKTFLICHEYRIHECVMSDVFTLTMITP